MHLHLLVSNLTSLAIGFNVLSQIIQAEQRYTKKIERVVQENETEIKALGGAWFIENRIKTLLHLNDEGQEKK